LVIGREEKIKTLEEVVQRLEAVKVVPHLTGELDFDDARIDGYVVTALSASRAALSATVERQKTTCRPVQGSGRATSTSPAVTRV